MPNHQIGSRRYPTPPSEASFGATGVLVLSEGSGLSLAVSTGCKWLGPFECGGKWLAESLSVGGNNGAGLSVRALPEVDEEGLGEGAKPTA